MSENQIREKLLECYQERKPVLLYGKDNFDRKDLIIQIHKKAGGIDEEKECLIHDGRFKSVEELENRLNCLHADKKFLEWHELLTHYPSISTTRTFKYVNLGGMNGEEVYITMVHDTDIVEEFLRNYSRREIEKYDYFEQIQWRNKGILPINGYMFKCKGLLFLNNLRCNSEKKNDVEYYDRLARIIEEKEIRHESITFNWLVAYTYDPEPFHQNFIERFEPIPLYSEIEEEKEMGFAAFRSTQQSIDKETASFPTPHNTKWEDVEMYLIDEDHFKIIIKPIEKIVTYSQMGFKKEKSTKKTQLWSVLLKFAMANNSAVKYYGEKEKVEKDIQRLNDVLIGYFGISGNPITYKRDKKGYEAKFKIYDKSYLKEKMDSIARKTTDEERLDGNV